MAKHRKQASAKIGMMPGSAVYVGEQPPQPTNLRIHIYDKGSYYQLDTFDTQLIKEALAANKHVWIDIHGLAKGKSISQWCQDFAIHPLIVEDILNTKQRLKLDIMQDGLFIVLRILDTPEHHLNYSSEQFSMLVKKNLLFTFRESDNYDFTHIYERLLTENSLVRPQGIEYLTYLILDSIVDDYFNYVEETEKTLDDIEDLLVTDMGSISLKQLYLIKRRTLTLRKVIAPMRDIVHLLLTEHGRLINSQYLLHYRDLHDHAIRLLEHIDLHREMSTNILEIYLSTVNNRMNETMKVLTLFASIFIPLSFIASVYGMNFEFMPELKWRFGYPGILVLMIFLALTMLYFFKKRKLI